jgi:AcrR family transcriptional regulator
MILVNIGSDIRSEVSTRLAIMGLREMKAARSRQTMMDVALELFLRDGFDETTMEQIAERAEVGTTTLYRYFPSKDQLLLDPLVEALDPSPYLRARPTDERLEISLGEALIAAAAAFDDAGTYIAEMRRLVDAAAVPRAKLWDRLRTLREDLENVIAERMGRHPDDLSVRATAGLMLDLFHLLDRGTDDGRTRREVMIDLLRDLPTSTILIPRPLEHDGTDS